MNTVASPGFLRWAMCLTLAIAALSQGCSSGSSVATPTPSPTPTSTASPTPTPVPTATPAPTPTPVPKFVFAATGAEQSFTVPTGVKTLKVKLWGAGGGNYGGSGAFVSGNLAVTAGETLSIIVGAKGVASERSIGPGGFGGGEMALARDFTGEERAGGAPRSGGPIWSLSRRVPAAAAVISRTGEPRE